MARAKCHHTMDAFMKLVVVLVRYSGDAANTTSTKVNLLNKVRQHCCSPFFNQNTVNMPLRAYVLPVVVAALHGYYNCLLEVH